MQFNSCCPFLGPQAGLAAAALPTSAQAAGMGRRAGSSGAAGPGPRCPQSYPFAMLQQADNLLMAAVKAQETLIAECTVSK